MWPLSVGYISSYFGNRYIGKREDFHCGIDIACATGTPVYAANSGVVVESSYHQTYGYYVVVFHGPDANGDSYATLYGHLSTANVATGTVVSKGDVIGEVGSSGISLGSHLHFGFFLNGTALDPKNYIVQN